MRRSCKGKFLTKMPRVREVSTSHLSFLSNDDDVLGPIAAIVGRASLRHRQGEPGDTLERVETQDEAVLGLFEPLDVLVPRHAEDVPDGARLFTARSRRQRRTVRHGRGRFLGRE